MYYNLFIRFERFFMDKTIRLFDQLPSESEFEARVLSCLPDENGNYTVVLDKTLFFPEEGGQACDTGLLGGAEVIHVCEKERVIYHTVAEPLAEGSLVSGKIDFCERFRKMQNHTGEHIVSGLIFKNFGFSNVGFHLGKDIMTADFDGVLDAEQLLLIETLANRAVFECHAVRGYYPSTEELETLEYRSKLDLCENVRIVEIEGVDKCACCAPHVSNTGQVGLIKILECEKYKGGIRLYMKCGFDALDGYRAEYEQSRRISVAISARHDEVAHGVDRLLEDISSLKGEIAALKRSLMAYKLEKIEATDGNICIFEDAGLDAVSLRNMANEIKKRCGGICAVFTGDDEGGYKYIIASATVDLRDHAKEINAAISGRGGGSSEMIQGSCAAKRAEIEEYFA